MTSTLQETCQALNFSLGYVNIVVEEGELGGHNVSFFVMWTMLLTGACGIAGGKVTLWGVHGCGSSIAMLHSASYDDNSRHSQIRFLS